jgi:1,3-beta-glucanosyltransferase GAS5
MRSFTYFAGVVGVLAAVVNASLNPIVVKGNAFFDSVTGKRFYIRGVDYQVFLEK